MTKATQASTSDGTTPTPTNPPAPTGPEASRLRADGVTLAYDERVISTNLSVAIPDKSFTVIIGPNACGKSTLMRGLSRLLKPKAGTVYLDDDDIFEEKPKQVAKKLGLLPQSSIAPEGITVADLVARGRFPYQSLIQQWTPDDEKAVSEAMEATGITDLSGRLVSELSGGQRQRVWVAMALAQQTEILLLDEPTTYLDITYQIELMELFTDLNLAGRTLVAVLHDLNHATRYATHLIAMKAGTVISQGSPAEIVTSDLIEDVFGLPAKIVPDPVVGSPAIVPLGTKRDKNRRPIADDPDPVASSTADHPNPDQPNAGEPNPVDPHADQPPAGQTTKPMASTRGSVRR